MSKWFKENIVMAVINLLLLIIISVIGFNVRAMVTKVNEVEQRANDYTDRTMETHEIKEQIMLNRIENIITLSNERQDAFLEGQKELVRSIDSRLKRIEDKTD